MKTLTAFILLIVLAFIMPPRVNAQFEGEYLPSYSPQNQQMLRRALEGANQRYTENIKYIELLYRWVYDLKLQTNESKFNKEMDSYILQLDTLFQSETLHNERRRIIQIENRIKQSILNYNQRIEESIRAEREANRGPRTTTATDRSAPSKGNAQAETSESKHVNTSVLVRTGNAYIRNEPHPYAEKIIRAPKNRRVRILEKARSGYWKVSYNSRVGYINEVHLIIE